MNENETDWFRKSMNGVRPIYTDKVLHHPPKPPPDPVQTRKDEARVMEKLLDARYDPAEFQPGDVLIFKRPNVSKAVLQKLRKGQYSLSTELDLHGMTRAEAEQALTRFFTHVRDTEARCVRIVHGKGRRSRNRGPVLKPLASKWLTKRDDVLAFCSARPIDGGTGALYVLLKR
jgi:DNA-nicking Smr family endonuclease